jgi:hypothetical protein
LSFGNYLDFGVGDLGFHLDFSLSRMLKDVVIKIISKVLGYVFSRPDHGLAEVLGRAGLHPAATL